MSTTQNGDDFSSLIGVQWFSQEKYGHTLSCLHGFSALIVLSVVPYTSMSWTEGNIHKEVSADKYWHSLGVDRLHRCSCGIDYFDIAFTDGSMEENFENMNFKVHYFNHDYTIANFESECRFIHRWLHVFGFHHYDFSIDPPEAYDKNVMHRYIVVMLADRYRVGGSCRVLCLGSMTIKEDTSPCDIDIIRYQNFCLWDLSAKEGKPIIRREVNFHCGQFPRMGRLTYIPNIRNVYQGCRLGPILLKIVCWIVKSLM